MVDKKKKMLYTKLAILIICLMIVIRIFVLVLSKYDSISSSIADVDIALFLLNEDYKTMTTNLASIFPQDNAYIYTFSIGNEDGEKRAEVDLTYDLTLRTTTNLPLTYELYMNQLYTDEGATNIIKENKILPDEYGTYFRTMTTEQVTLKYTENVTNVYQLVVYFPSNYNKDEYQDIIEALEITVDAKQVMSQE